MRRWVFSKIPTTEFTGVQEVCGYSFCESVAAYVWHIRPLTSVGRKLGGERTPKPYVVEKSPGTSQHLST
jgi:hypothetical protein